MEQFNELKEMRERIFAIASKPNTKHFHSHKVGQLSTPINGIMYLLVHKKVFIIPPQMAIFIPANIKHRVYKINCNTIIKNVYFMEDYFPKLPKDVKTLNLSELANALITRLCQTAEEHLVHTKTSNILNVLLDELCEENDILSLQVNMPYSEKLQTIFDRIINGMDNLPSLGDCAKLINVSPRTLQRIVKKELNISFILWRQQITFAKSLELLFIHQRTSIVAYKLGYNSESAFISMFKKLSGQMLPSKLLTKLAVNWLHSK